MSTTDANAKAPAAAPATVTTGLLLAMVLLAVAVVFIHDTLVSAGAVSGSPWLAWFVDKATVISASSPWMLWAGPTAVLVGLVLVVAALKPRRSTHWAVGKQGVFIGRADAARLATNAAHHSPAVVDAQAAVTGRNKLRVTASTMSSVSTDIAAVTRQVEEAARQRLAPLTPGPTVRSRVAVKEN